MDDVLDTIANRLEMMNHRPPMSGANVYSLLEAARDEIIRLRAIIASWSGGDFSDAPKRIKEMSTSEFKETLVRLGINKPNGELTEKYETPRDE